MLVALWYTIDYVLFENGLVLCELLGGLRLRLGVLTSDPSVEGVGAIPSAELPKAMN